MALQRWSDGRKGKGEGERSAVNSQGESPKLVTNDPRGATKVGSGSWERGEDFEGQDKHGEATVFADRFKTP